MNTATHSSIPGAKEAAPFTPHIRRQWVPTCLTLIHNDNVRTTLRFAPCHVSRDRDVTYQVEFKVYGSDPTMPIWQRESPPLKLHDVYSVDSAEIAAATGRKELFCYVEETSRVVERGPLNAILTLNSQAHYYSKDASIQGHLGGFYIFGSPRKMLKGQYYHENFPGARIDENHKLTVFTMNPFTRPSEYSIVIVDAHGRVLESDWLQIGGKQAASWSSDAIAGSVLANPCGIAVRSHLKLSSFFATTDSKGRMISLDHGHAFLAQTLQH